MTQWIRRPAAYDPDKSLHENRYRDRGCVRCPQCQRAVDIVDDETECDCGQLFNLGGQALVPRSQWEEPYEPDDYY